MSLVLFHSCAKVEDDKNQDDDLLGQPITIWGTLDQTASQTKALLALSSNNIYKKVSVENNSFCIKLDNGKPWGLIFLGDANQPLGILTLGSGIESIPLHYITASFDKINLGTISKDVENFTPKHNPIGNEIPLDDNQIAFIAGQDDYPVSILRNPDVDGIGQIDVLEGKPVALHVIYFVKPGNFKGSATTPTLNTSTLVEGYRLFLTAQDNHIRKLFIIQAQPDLLYRTLFSISYLSFKDARVYNTPYLFDVSALVRNIMVQLGGSGLECKAIPNQNGLYGSDRLSTKNTSHTFACEDIALGIPEPLPGQNHVD